MIAVTTAPDRAPRAGEPSPRAPQGGHALALDLAVVRARPRQRRFGTRARGNGGSVHKQEFVDGLAERCELSKAEAGRVVDAILESLTQVMADGEEVSFTGFGKFLSQRRRAREGADPRDPSRKIRIRAANVPKFKPGVSLREAASHAPLEPGAAVASSRHSASGSGANTEPNPGEVAAEKLPRQPAEWRPLGERT